MKTKIQIKNTVIVINGKLTVAIINKAKSLGYILLSESSIMGSLRNQSLMIDFLIKKNKKGTAYTITDAQWSRSQMVYKKSTEYSEHSIIFKNTLKNSLVLIGQSRYTTIPITNKQLEEKISF